jgi:hypothetical protein
MPTLYELHDELQAAIAEHVDPETGEITDAGLEALAQVEMAFEQKALNVAAYVVSLRIKADGFSGEADGVKSHWRALERRAAACKNEAQRLLDYLQMHLEDGQKLEDERVRIGWGTATSVLVRSKPEHLPTWALKKRPPEADKKTLGDALKGELDDPLHPDRSEEAKSHAEIVKRRYVRVK